MRYIYLPLVSFSLREERSIYSLYVSLLYIERLNHSLYGSVDARKRSERAYQNTTLPPNHTEKLYSKHARIHTNIYILDMFLKYN